VTLGDLIRLPREQYEAFLSKVMRKVWSDMDRKRLELQQAKCKHLWHPFAKGDAPASQFDWCRCSYCGKEVELYEVFRRADSAD
jgi:hypothetical protein